MAGGHINPAVTFGLFLARKVSLIRAFMYMVAQCLGAICGCGLVKAFQKAYYNRYGGGANELASGYNKGTGLGAEIIGTFVLVYTVFSATDPKRNARDSHVPVSTRIDPLHNMFYQYRNLSVTNWPLDISRYWRRSPSGLQCSWSISPRSPSPEQASTPRGASERQ